MGKGAAAVVAEQILKESKINIEAQHGCRGGLGLIKILILLAGDFATCTGRDFLDRSHAVIPIHTALPCFHIFK